MQVTETDMEKETKAETGGEETKTEVHLQKTKKP
jgi:hypothetical protein